MKRLLPLFLALGVLLTLSIGVGRHFGVASGKRSVRLSSPEAAIPQAPRKPPSLVRADVDPNAPRPSRSREELKRLVEEALITSVKTVSSTGTVATQVDPDAFNEFIKALTEEEFQVV